MPRKPAEHQRIGNDEHTGNQSEVKEPAIADGVAQGADEGNRNDKMSKRQPVRAVEKKWMLRLCLRQCILNTQEPSSQF